MDEGGEEHLEAPSILSYPMYSERLSLIIIILFYFYVDLLLVIISNDNLLLHTWEEFLGPRPHLFSVFVCVLDSVFLNYCMVSY